MNPSGNVQFVYVVGDILPEDVDNSTIYVVGTEKKSIYIGSNFIVSDLTAEFETLRTYIENYLGSENFIEDIVTALQAMVTSGAFSELLAPIVAEELPDVVTKELPGVVTEELPGVVASQIDQSVASQISTPVSNWLAEHVDPQSQVVIDDSLTIRGAAADAKATGDGISQLKSALSDLEDEICYSTIVDSNATETDGFYMSGSYSNVNNTHNFKASVGKSTKVRIVGKINKNYDIYDFLDAENHVISYLASSSNQNINAEYDVPNGAVYVVSSNNKANGNITIMVSGEASNIDRIDDNLSEVNDALDFALNSKTELLTSENIHGFYMDGVYYENANTNTIKADVEGLAKIRISGVSSTNYDICDFLSKDNVVLSKNMAISAKFYDEEFTVPNGAKYVVSSNKGTESECKAYKYMPSDLSAENGNLKKVCMIKDDSRAFFRSKFTSVNDIIITASLHGSQNGSFNLGGYYTIDKNTEKGVLYGSTLIKDANDDIAPLFFAGSYRGGNHGDGNVKIVTVNGGHGLTEANIGEDWTDANSVDFIVLQVPSSTTLIVGNYTGESTPFSGVSPATSLEKSGVTINITNVDSTQLRYGINHDSVKVLSESGDEIDGYGIYLGNSFDVVESYDIIDVDAMVTYLQANIGDNTNASCYDESLPSWCTVTNIFHFTEQGSISVYTSTEWHKAFSDSRCGYVQSEKIGEYLSVPKTTDLTGITQQSGSVYITNSRWADADVPPDRYYQYTNSNGKMGVALGYNTEIGEGKANSRKTSSSVGLYNNTTYKMYPYAFNRAVSIGESIDVVSYRLIFDNYDSTFANVSWYYVGKDAYLVFNCETSVDAYLPLPTHLIGRLASIIESDGDVTLKSSFVTSKGLRIVIDGYGSATIKLS